MKFDRDLSYNPTQSELDLELAMIMSLSSQEAATYAAQAFAEVEALLEEAEEATEERRLIQTLEGRNSVIKLADRMVKMFCECLTMPGQVELNHLTLDSIGGV